MHPATFSATAVGIALLAGCATTQPVATPTASGSWSASTPASVGSEENAFSARGDTPRVLDPELLGGIVTEVRSHYDETRHSFATWPQFGHPGVDQAMSIYYLEVIRGYEAELADPGPHELNLGWRVLASSPQVVGVSSDGYRLAAGSEESLWRSFWFAPKSGLVLRHSDLVDPAATLAALRDAARTRPEVDLTKIGENPVVEASLLAFGTRGELILGFDQCKVAECDQGLVTLTIPREKADSVLSQTGRQARSASLAPTDPTSAIPPPTTRVAPTPPVSPTSAPTSDQTDVDCRKQKCVALTFDDGPGPYTSKLLGYLAEKDVRATFFVLGQQVEAYPKVARAAAGAGHELGVHTWDHRDLTRLGKAEINTEIRSTVREIGKEAQVKPRWLRPPYGAMNARVRASAKQAGLALALWDVDTLDWKTRSKKKTVAAALKQARKGSVILMHDIHRPTVEAVPDIIDGLRAKGYTPVTVSQLFGKVKPGHKYFHR